MSKEELLAQGWDISYSGPCPIKAWGAHLVNLKHSSGRRISGYGSNELEALNDAAATIQKPLEIKNEIRH